MDKMLVDLHIHTKASDGTWDRHELIERLMQNNIGLFSITDHDTIENSKVMASELEGSDLKYLMGVEVSCTHMRKEHHIVAYGFDTTNSGLLGLLEQNQKERSRTQDNLMRWLATVKPQVSYSKYASYQHERKRGGWKSLNFLLDEAVVKDLSEYITLFDDPTTKFTFQDPAAVIQAVKQAQGIPFLAHPSWHFDGGRMPEKELKKWVDFGISGIECYHPSCCSTYSEEYIDFCRRHNLLISGGSDCHGTFTETKLGSPRITLDNLNLGSLIQERADS